MVSVQGRAEKCGLASWWCARVTRPEHVGFGSVLSATLWERRRTSSAELERSAAIPLAGMQLDSSPLVLVAEVSSGLLALRPRPIVRDVGLSLLRAPGRGCDQAEHSAPWAGMRGARRGATTIEKEDRSRAHVPRPLLFVEARCCRARVKFDEEREFSALLSSSL